MAAGNYGAHGGAEPDEVILLWHESRVGSLSVSVLLFLPTRASVGAHIAAFDPVGAACGGCGEVASVLTVGMLRLPLGGAVGSLCC